MSTEPVFLYSNPIGMRILFLILLMVTGISLQAQTQFAPGMMNYSQSGLYNNFPNTLRDSANANKKWSLYKYGGISANYGVMNGTGFTSFSAPIGVQLNRKLTDNIYAFAGISAVPTYYSFNSSFVNTNINKYSPNSMLSNTNGFGMYSRFEAGLMYVNDAKTFSISGSIGVNRGSSPYYPANPSTIQRQQPISGSRQ